MIKKSVCALLCAFLLCQLLPLGALTVWSAEATELHITNADELLQFSRDIASGDSFAGVTVYLDNDITCNEGELSSMTKAELDALSWKWHNVDDVDFFDGVFDGQGHTISGIYFCPSSPTATGLFGATAGKDATVKNLIITNSVIIGMENYSAILFGSCSGNITLSNLYIDADLRTDHARCGGLVGYYKTNTLSISSCVYAGTITTVSGKAEIGGLLGRYSTGTVNIQNSAFQGEITGSAKKIGGLIGGVYNTSLTVTNSLSMGSLPEGASALIGYTNKSLQLTNNLYIHDLNPALLDSNGSLAEGSAMKVSADALMGTAAISTLADYGFSAWKGCYGYAALPATVADMLTNKEIDPSAVAPTQFVGYQIAQTESGTAVHLRLIAVVDSTLYEAIGFRVTLKNDVLGEMTHVHRTQTVYESLTGYDEEEGRVDYTAKSLGGAYIFALNIKNIPIENGVYEFTVSTYHETNGTEVTDGESKTFTVDFRPQTEA